MLIKVLKRSRLLIKILMAKLIKKNCLLLLKQCFKRLKCNNRCNSHNKVGTMDNPAILLMEVMAVDMEVMVVTHLLTMAILNTHHHNIRHIKIMDTTLNHHITNLNSPNNRHKTLTIKPQCTTAAQT